MPDTIRFEPFVEDRPFKKIYTIEEWQMLVRRYHRLNQPHALSMGTGHDFWAKEVDGTIMKSNITIDLNHLLTTPEWATHAAYDLNLHA